MSNFFFNCVQHCGQILGDMDASPTENELLKPAAVARQLETKTSTVWNWCRTGKLPHIRLSARNYRIRQRDLNVFLDARCR